MKIFKETELSQVSVKEYLDRVKNTTRKAIFPESCFKVILILFHILNEYLNNINIGP